MINAAFYRMAFSSLFGGIGQPCGMPKNRGVHQGLVLANPVGGAPSPRFTRRRNLQASARAPRGRKGGPPTTAHPCGCLVLASPVGAAPLCPLGARRSGSDSLTVLTVPFNAPAPICAPHFHRLPASVSGLRLWFKVGMCCCNIPIKLQGANRDDGHRIHQQPQSGHQSNK